MKIIPQGQVDNAASEMSMEDIQKLLVTTINSLKESNVKGASYRPYYKKEYAEQISVEIEKVHVSGKAVFFPRGDYTISTIRARIYQAIEYLKDHLDPSGEWKKKCDRISCKTIYRRGVSLEPKRYMNLTSDTIDVEWRPDFMRWLDECSTTKNNKFERLVPITSEDITWFTEQISPVKHLFIWDIGKQHIKIIRFDKPHEL